jgi:hypothetical protein
MWLEGQMLPCVTLFMIWMSNLLGHAFRPLGNNFASTWVNNTLTLEMACSLWTAIGYFQAHR